MEAAQFLAEERSNFAEVGSEKPSQDALQKAA
jgi:hypothetical protein